MIGGKQTVNIGRGCERKGTVQHEILHALGRVHEQSRPDRDNYVIIKRNNIERGIIILCHNSYVATLVSTFLFLLNRNGT